MRPQLAPGAYLRTYLGRHERMWLIGCGPGRPRRRVDATVRGLVELCDGTRNAAQLARAAAEHVARVLDPREVERLLRPLFAEGVLIDLDAPAEDPRARQDGIGLVVLDEELRVVTPPGVGLGCHGRGGCCRLYDRLCLDGGDATRLRAAYAGEPTPSGLSIEAALGRDRADEEMWGLAVSGGNCALLLPDGGCDIHRRAGMDDKPHGCRSFPLRGVKCGDELHIGLLVECRCAIDFADTAPSTLEAEARWLVEWHKQRRLVEAVLPEVVLSRPVPRDEYLAWRAVELERLARADDVLDWARTALPDVEPPDVRLEALRAWLAFEAADTARLYDPEDLQRRLFNWANAAAQRISSSHSPVEGEKLVAQQLLFAHGLLRGPSVSRALSALVLRLHLARAGATVPIPSELLPMGAVEYLGRAQSLGRIFD